MMEASASLVAHWPTEAPSHTNLYLHANSHHHPSNEQAVLSELVHRARTLSDHESLLDELQFLRDTFRQNGYDYRQIQRTLNPLKRVNPHPEKLISVALLTFLITTFNSISRMLLRRIKSVGLPPKKITNYIRPVKEDPGL
jgi:hypothetical protein